MVAAMITVDYSDEYPCAYYDDWEGITSANNPEFWYALGMLKPNYPVPALRYHVQYYVNNRGLCHAISLAAMAKVKAWWPRS